MYNRLIDWLFEEGWSNLTVLLQVAGDLIVTIFFGIVYGFEAAAVLLSLFVFAGLVMIWGAFRRNQKRK
ncbi:MAG TPA: hypothetical protein VEC96_13910, partial [Anaerolineae bacterium]|nr:hypothetical protein [Anaerolineae bacterium]